MAEIKMTPLGGLYEFGNQSYLYKVNNSAIVIDTGAFFDDEQPQMQIMPDYSQLDKIAKDLKAIIITHNHEDHFGGLTYVMDKYRHIPVYCTSFVASNIKRRLQVEGIVMNDLQSRVKIVKQGRPETIDKNFTIEFIGVNHSTPQASMVYLTTPMGNVLHTGDWRYERNPLRDAMDWTRLAQIGKQGLTALVADSTGIENLSSPQSETDVAKGLDDVIRRHIDNQTVMIFGAFSTHVERVATICQLAKKYNRLPKLMGTGMLINQEVGLKHGMLPMRRIETDETMSSSHAFYIATGTQAEQGSVLERLSKEVPLPKPACVVMSASVIPSRAGKIARMVAGLRANGYQVVQNNADNLTHVSGHAPRADVEELIKLVKPEIFIPIHGEAHHLLAAEKVAQDLYVPQVVRLDHVGQSVSFSQSRYAALHEAFEPKQIVKKKSFSPQLLKQKNYQYS